MEDVPNEKKKKKKAHKNLVLWLACFRVETFNHIIVTRV